MKIDLNTGTMKDGTRILIQGRIAKNGYHIPDTPVSFQDLEQLYREYRNSVPFGRKNNSRYFYAPPAEELPMSALLNGTSRQAARERLEAAVLIGSLNGSLIWPEPKKWFWQSKKEPGLVILRHWITGQTKQKTQTELQTTSTGEILS